MSKKYEFHPAANVMPLIEGSEFDTLVNDIREKGLLTSIVLLDGMILDGRNRYRACLEAKVKPKFVQYKGDLEVFDYVWSLNAERRHLSAGQRAMAVSEIKRMRNEWQKRDELAKLNQNSQNLTDCSTPLGVLDKSNKELYEKHKVKERTVQRTDAILNHGNKDLIQAVKDNKISTTKAEKLIEIEDPKVITDILSGIKPISEAIPDKPRRKYNQTILDFLGVKDINMENLALLIKTATTCPEFGNHKAMDCKASGCVEGNDDIRLCRIWEYRYGNTKWEKPVSDVIDDIEEVLPPVDEIPDEE